MTSSLHILATAQHRGAERFALELVAAMKAAGADARPVALWPGGPAPLLEVECLGSSPYGWSTLHSLRALAEPGIPVVAHGSSTLTACALALPRQPPFVYRGIGEPHYWSTTTLRRLRIKALVSRATAVVVMWPRAADEMRELYGRAIRRIEIIPKGIDTAVAPLSVVERVEARARFGISSDAACAAYLGALSPEKDPLAAVHAAASIEGLHLVLIGGGPLRSDVERVSARLLPRRHTIVGPVDNPRAALAAADLLILPSRTEGVPSAPLEAGLLGLPSVVTNVGGAPSTVVDHESGRVAPAGDTAGLKDALLEVVQHAPEMGLAAREHVVTSFDIGRTAAAWLALCDTLVA